jgi:hypothetical protein
MKSLEYSYMPFIFYLMTAWRAESSVAVADLPLHFVVAAGCACSSVTVADLSLVDCLVALLASSFAEYKIVTETYQAFDDGVGLRVADLDGVGLCNRPLVLGFGWYLRWQNTSRCRKSGVHESEGCEERGDESHCD